MNDIRRPSGVYRSARLAGNLTNDNSNQSDRLGYHVYAETLAASLHQTPAPITVGIFGSWGIGKTFVAKRVQDLLKKMERQDNVVKESRKSHFHQRMKNVLEGLLSFFVFCVLLATMVIIIFDYSTNHSFNPLQPTNSSNTGKITPRLMDILSWTLLSLSCLILVFTSVLVLSNGSSKSSRSFQSYWILLLYTMLTNIPLKRASDLDENIAGKQYETVYEEETKDVRNDETGKRNTLKTKYIFVDFNAWQYVGSDMLWAGIILNIAEAVEKEFGAVCVRLFRMLQSDNDSLDEERCDVASSNGFYLQSPSEEQDMESTLKRFGVVKTIDKGKNAWFIQFDDPMDERQAFRNLKNYGFNVSNTADTCRVQYETSTFGDASPQKKKMDKEYRIAGTMAISAQQNYGRHKGSERGFFKHLRANPRRVSCGCQYGCCLILFVLSFIVTLAGSILMMATSFGTNLKAQVEGDFSPGKTVIAVLPPVLLGTAVIARFAWAMFNSQIRRISNAVDGAKGSISAGLGLMNTIKEEVAILSKLINVVRFTHEVEYKIVITVDDLDRCPLKMVRKVLEAISVLLSDDSSPFVCLVVANPRVVSKCIEGGMEDALIKANITGHEYMKKIINLPFCIPSVSCLKRFCEGVNDTVDANIIRAGSVEDDIDFQDSAEDNEPSTVPGLDDHRKSFKGKDRNTSWKKFKILDDHIMTFERKECKISFKEFKIKCRMLLEGKDKESDCIHEYLVSNPRNVKRILNVLMITIRLLETTREWAEFTRKLSPGSPEKSTLLEETALKFGDFEVDAVDLVKWIILTDQWPFLMSCMLYHMQDVHVYEEEYQRAEVENKSLLDIYVKLESDLERWRKRCTLSSLDCNPKLLKKFLGECLTLNVRRVKTLLRFTVNLDPSLKQELSSHFN